MGLAFTVKVANVEEDDRPHLKPNDLVLNNAILKAESVANKVPDALVWVQIPPFLSRIIFFPNQKP